MKKKLFFCAFMLFIAGWAYAQYTVSGTVRSATDNKPVPFANVAAIRTVDSAFVSGTTTGIDGHYSITLDTAAIFLRISAIGFETVYQSVADKDKIDIVMQEGSTTLGEVQVVARKPMYAADGDKKIYNVSEDPTIQNGTAQDALKNTPGVEVDGDGNITLNGKAVAIYINDKKSHYSGEMLKQYIKTLTADQIASIEAIEFPSAKYGGGGPVINICTGQKLLKNSYLSFGGSGSTRPQFSPFVSYAHATEKLRFDVYARYSGYRYESIGSGDGRILNEDSLVVRNYQYKSSYSSWDHNPNFSFSFGYDIDSMNTVSAYMSAYPSWDKSTNDYAYMRYDLIGAQLENYSNSKHSEAIDNYMSTSGSIDYEHKFNNDGHEISFSLGVGRWASKSSSSSWEHYVAQPHMNFDDVSKLRNPSGSVDFGINYSLPYSENGELSASLDLSSEYDHVYSRRDTLGTDGMYHCDFLRSDSTDSPSNNAGLHLSWRRKWGHFTMRINGNAIYKNSASRHLGLPQYDTTVQYLTLTPGILLMYNTEDMHSFNLNYSMYKSQPSAGQFSRFVEYGTNSFSSGNPLLEPSYSHNLSANYSKSFEKGHSLGISAFYLWELNNMGTLTMPVYSPFFGRYVVYSQPYNVGNTRYGSIRAYARLRFSAKFSMNLSGGVRDNWYRRQVLPGEWFENELASWNIRLSSRAKLFNLVWVSASGYYYSRSADGWGVSVDEPRYGVDISASADLFDRKLSLYFDISDLFNTEGWSSTSINPYFPSTRESSSNSQYIAFGLTLRFGKMELAGSGNEGIQSGGGKGK